MTERREPTKRWREWPQGLAPNVVGSMFGRGGNAARPGYHWTLLRTAQKLAAKFDPELPLETIVVFYPRRLAKMIRKGLRRVELSKKGLDEYKGLVICTMPDLRSLCVAFRIEDVEAHRTPADALHIDVMKTDGRRRKVRPVPLYTAQENFGKEIME